MNLFSFLTRKNSPQRSDMAHTLLDPETDDSFGTPTPLHKYACSCGNWRRIYTQDRLPRFQEIESAHTDHQHQMGAEELRTGKKPAENALEEILRAMARVAAESVKASEAMEEFIEAHKEAKGRGMGVVVVRQADGSTTSTPNVFVPAGTAIFMEEPSLFVPSGPLELVPDPIPHTSTYQREALVDGHSVTIIQGNAA